MTGSTAALRRSSRLILGVTLASGVPNTGTITFEVLSVCIHPEDLDRVRAAFAATRDMLGAYRCGHHPQNE